MHGSDLLLVVDPIFEDGEIDSRVRTALSHWTGHDRPQVRKIDTHRFIEDPPKLDQVVCAWLVLEDEGSSSACEVIGLVQDAHIPAMISLPGGGRDVTGFEDGIVSCSLEAEPAQIYSVLRSLWSQAAVLSDLRREIRMLRAHEEGLCGQIALLDEELRMAAQLQKEFMPTDLPSVGGVDFEVLWRPAGYVSGDIYDVSRLDEHHLGLFIADAVGHGVPAALMTVHIKRSMPTKLIDPSYPGGYRILSPGEALAVLNREMIQQQSGKVRFATAAYGVIDTRTNKLTFARAGHPYPLILRADGGTETLEPEGGLLGVFPDEEFEEVTVDLGVGDRVLLYSDGFEVAFPKQEAGENGEAEKRTKIATDQYTQEFEDLRHGNAQAALERLVERLNMQSGSLNQRDDLTVVCMTISAKADESANDTNNSESTASAA